MKNLTFKKKNYITVIILAVLVMAILFFLTRPKKEVEWAVTPHVVVNNEIYSYGFSDLCYEEGKLPEDYIEIGHVKSTVSASENASNWGSNACDVGDIIYKSPNNPNEILVYTKLFAGDKYHYLGFGTADNEEAVLPSKRLSAAQIAALREQYPVFVRKYPEYIEVIEAPLPLEAVQSMSDTIVYGEIVEEPGRYDYSVDGMYYVTPEEYVISVIDEENGIKDMNMNGVKVDTLLEFFEK